MTGEEKANLSALQRRLSHAESIARLVARDADDGDVSEAAHGVAAILADAGERIDQLMDPPPA